MKTILIVDKTIASLSEILSRLGCNVIREQNSRAALSVLKENAAVDLVITEERFTHFKVNYE